MSIGAVLFDQDENELEKFQMNLAIPTDKKYEDRCVEEFWKKNPEAWENATKDQEPPVIVMKHFETFCDMVEEKYPNLVLVSDNSSFDFQWINFYLNKYTGRRPLNYDSKGNYRNLIDVHSMMKSLVMLDGDFESSWGFPEKLEIINPYPNCHDSLNDARFIGHQYIQVVRQIKNTIKREEYVKQTLEDFKNNEGSFAFDDSEDESINVHLNEEDEQ
jgi:hypothetical protein